MSSDSDVPNFGSPSHKHPPHLRGKSIGMFYARRNKKKKRQEDDKQRLVVPMNEEEQRDLSELLLVIQSKTYESSSLNYSFKKEFWRNSDASYGGEQRLHRNSILRRIPHLDMQFYKEFLEQTKTKEYNIYLEKRSSLPSFQKREAILSLIKNNQVIVVTGETGCGKTTQVPQYLLDSFLASKNGSLCKIVCTQPRRISAISVAERVAEERQVPCGRDGDTGYQIRLENKLPRQLGSILFCTTGIMLQQLQNNPRLDGISHVIVDEVHERDILSDFLLINLKDILTVRVDLKVILMSATMNATAFSDYFGNCPMIEIPGFTYPVKEYTLEEMIELVRYEPPNTAKLCPTYPRSKRGRRAKQQALKDMKRKAEQEEYLATLSTKFTPATIRVLRNWDEEEVDTNLIVEMMKFICTNSTEGAILVFLPGWSTISSLNKSVTECGFFHPSRFLIIPLHSLMPTLQQREVFEEPRAGVRKIIMATNIAETSITINDVVYVIDSGKIKMKSIDLTSNIQLLKPEWVAQSNMKQRRGRAGRTQPGVCYHMFTRLRESKLEAYQLPELLRSSLEELVLTIKILKLGKAMPFLQKAMDPPNMNTVTQSINTLIRLNALTEDENLTPLGYYLARLPMDVHTGKMILLGAIFSCLDPILSVAASLSFKDAFVIPLGKESAVDNRRYELAEGTQSDHLMYATVIHQWEVAKRRGNESRFCWKNFLSSSTLKMLADLKMQYAEHLRELKFLIHSDPKHPDYNRNSKNELLLKAIICAGLYPNVAKVCSRKQRSARRIHPLTAITEDQKKVTVHPKSVNSRELNLRSDWLVYHLKIKSNSIYLHDATLVTAYALLFFGGKLEIGNVRGYETISIDNWIVLQCSASKAKIVMDLRKELDDLLEYKITNPGISNWDPDTKEGLVLKSITQLISSEETLTVEDLEFFYGQPLRPGDDDEEEAF